MVLKLCVDRWRRYIRLSWSWHQEKFRWYIRIISIAPCGENYQPRWTYIVRESQIKIDSRWKPLLNHYKYSLRSNRVWNYRETVGMLIYIQGSTWPVISMSIHQWEFFFNNPCLVHKRAVRRIEDYLVITSTYADLPDVTLWLTTCGVVYRQNIEKGSECYVDANFYGG